MSEKRPFRVFVGYETEHGSTRGVAQALARRLVEAGQRAEVHSMHEAFGLAGYDAVVLGSAIHNGAWLPPAADFVKAHARDFAGRPVWLFSVCSIGETTGFFGRRVGAFARRVRKETPEMASYRHITKALGHRHFAGAIEPSHWNLVGRCFFGLFGGTYGDHRDWADIDVWADEIAGRLNEQA